MSDQQRTVLELLSSGLTPEDPRLDTYADELSHALWVAVPSFIGFTVHTSEFSFSWGPFLPARPGAGIHAASTLRWVVDATTSAPVRFVLYASKKGAWVDMSADLAWLTRCPLPQFLLDRDLAATIAMDLPELLTTSTFNQAIGVLLTLGYPLDEAMDELDARARADDTNRPTAAQALLDGLAPALPPRRRGSRPSNVASRSSGRQHPARGGETGVETRASVSSPSASADNPTLFGQDGSKSGSSNATGGPYPAPALLVRRARMWVGPIIGQRSASRVQSCGFAVVASEATAAGG